MHRVEDGRETGGRGTVGKAGLFITVEKADPEGDDECLQWNRDSRRPCGMNLGCKKRKVWKEAIDCAEIVKKA